MRNVMMYENSVLANSKRIIRNLHGSSYSTKAFLAASKLIHVRYTVCANLIIFIRFGGVEFSLGATKVL